MLFSTPANRLLFQTWAQVYNKENIKARNQWSFLRGIYRWLDCCVTKTSQPVASYIILNTDGHIWTNLFITAYSKTDMTVLRKYITSQWRYVRDMASQITGNSTVVFRLNEGDIKAQYYWPFVGGIHLYLIIIIIFIIITIIITFRHYHYYCNYHYYHFQLSSLLSLFSIIIVIVIIVVAVCLCYHDYNHYHYHYYYHYYWCFSCCCCHNHYYYHHHVIIITIIIII